MKIAKVHGTCVSGSPQCRMFGVSADGSRTKDVTVVQEDSQVYEIIQKIEDTDGFKELKEAVPAVADGEKLEKARST